MVTNDPLPPGSWEGDPERLKALLDAVLVIEAYLDLPMVLQRIVDSATSLAGARYGALGVLDTDRKHLSAFYTSGISEEHVRLIGDLPSGKGILGVLISDPRPVRIADLSRDPRSSGFPANHPEMRSFLGVPVRVRGDVFGNLYLAEKVGAAEFTVADQEIIVALSRAAGIAVDNARLHGYLRELSLAQDRERIARDLHDTVVQRLFATGLSLQSLVRRAPNSEVAERLEAAVDDLDDTITQIRSTIFALGKERVDRGGLRSEVMTLALGSAPSLGFEPRIELRGEIDSVSDPGLCEHVVAALREALSNVARHARASSAEVIVDVSDTEMLLMVVDDGIGVAGTAPRPGGQGVVNLARRAELLGGEMTLSDLSGRGACGTELVWRVPLRVNETP
ncbi:MAG: GAF domain-containing protein [Actinomycetota bacterium]|nr:GAF domain-containing protein [Actinomycetota bacterium]